jgi:hypothetical protein
MDYERFHEGLQKARAGKGFPIASKGMRQETGAEARQTVKARKCYSKQRPTCLIREFLGHNCTRS